MIIIKIKNILFLVSIIFACTAISGCSGKSDGFYMEINGKKIAYGDDKKKVESSLGAGTQDEDSTFYAYLNDSVTIKYRDDKICFMSVESDKFKTSSGISKNDKKEKISKKHKYLDSMMGMADTVYYENGAEKEITVHDGGFHFSTEDAPITYDYMLTYYYQDDKVFCVDYGDYEIYTGFN